MADEALSQDAIEALLAAHGVGDAPADPEPAPVVEHEVALVSDEPLVADEALAAAAFDAAAAVAAPAGPLADVIHDAVAGSLPIMPEPIVEDVALETLIPLDAEPQASADISMLLEVPLDIAVELGRTRLTIRELLDINQGSILELDKLAGEPVDVLVNGKPLARGEVVVIDEEFGIRITDVVSQEERLRSMGR
jgi:flagellar motor switch protein FliN/FliY